jgi:hypothetical protein
MAMQKVKQGYERISVPSGERAIQAASLCQFFKNANHRFGRSFSNCRVQGFFMLELLQLLVMRCKMLLSSRRNFQVVLCSTFALALCELWRDSAFGSHSTLNYLRMEEAFRFTLSLKSGKTCAFKASFSFRSLRIIRTSALIARTDMHVAASKANSNAVCIRWKRNAEGGAGKAAGVCDAEVVKLMKFDVAVKRACDEPRALLTKGGRSAIKVRTNAHDSFLVVAHALEQAAAGSDIPDAYLVPTGRGEERATGEEAHALNGGTVMNAMGLGEGAGVPKTDGVVIGASGDGVI